MADCSYAKCLQQRRNIKRELQRWTKNMVHIVGLERIAEELMGRRKWKIYQDSMSRSYLQPLNNNIKRSNNPSLSEDDCYQHYHKVNNIQKSRGKANSISSETESEQKDTEKEEEETVTAPARRDEEEDVKGDCATAGGEEESAETAERVAVTNGTDSGAKENEPDSSVAENTKEENDEEIQDRLKDWTPATKCYFCVDGKLDSEHAAHGVLSPRPVSDSDSSDSRSDNEDNNGVSSPHRLSRKRKFSATIASGGGIQLPAGMTSVDVALMAALTGGAAPPGGAAGGLPYFSPTMLSHNWYLANVARQFQNAAQPAVDAVVDKGISGASGEQPLDLSKGASNNNSNDSVKMENNVRLPTLDTKQIFNSDFRAKPRMSAVAGRRTYTEDELQAALRDIQSGKLGTRRAAVIYGIPRSTLRNKVYKLALERERESHLNTSTPPNLKLEDDEAMDDDKELSGAEEEKEVEKALQAPLLSIMDLLRLGSDPEALKIFLQKAQESQDTGPEQTEVIRYIQALLASQNILANQKHTEGSVLNHLIPEFAKRVIAEDQFIKVHSNGENERLSRPSPSNSVITKVEKKSESDDMDADDSPSNVILKIPSFKPTSSKNGHDIIYRSETPSRLVSPPVTSDSGSPPILPGKNLVMKDIITQSISQKFQQSLAEPPMRRPLPMEIDFKRGGFTPPMGNMTSVIKSQHDLTRQFQQQAQREPPKPQGSGGQSSGGKGTRPKRGKYRNYDRDSLVEAVRAVQRGEMSVHRAGSYYGVPHSTLEYKVKERHLMRPRKRDPKPNPVDEKIASLKQNDLRNAQEKLKPAIKPPQQKFSPTSPNGIKLPIFDAATAALNPAAAASLAAGYNHPPFPFWPHPGFPHNPLEYAAAARTSGATPFLAPNPEFFASQMMQKLQEESSRIAGSPSPQGGSATLAKNTRHMAESLLDGSGSNGSFLDGIIRSSLESGVPSADDKSLKADKSVAPENMSNKALLEQLCRNSRLTPLSVKPDSNSSEDESYRRGSSPINFSTSNQDDSSRSPTRSIKENSDAPNDDEDANLGEAKHHPRIYLKKDLVNPENLKPQLLVRFPDLLPERNGGGDSKTGGSCSGASDNEALQD